MEAGSPYGGGSSPVRGPGRARRSRKDPAGVRILREMGTSPMFLTAVIAYTASVALTIIGSAVAASSSPVWLSSLLNMAGSDVSLYELESMFSRYRGMMGGAGFVSALIGSIPAIITAVALWLIYVNAKKEPGEEFSTAGFTILHVLATISFVLIVIGIVLYVVIGIAGVGSISRLSDGEGTGAGILIFLMMGVLVVFPIIYIAKLRTMLDSSKKMAAGGPVEQTASIYVGVIVMLQVLGSLGGLVFSPGILKLQALASGTASVCFSLLIFSFRERCLNPALASEKLHHGEEPFSEERPFYEDEPAYGNYPAYEDVPSPAAGAGGYNPAEWTGYEPEAVHLVAPSVQPSDRPGAADPYETIVEPAVDFDPGLFRGDSEDTIVEAYPGAFSRGAFQEPARTSGHLSGSDTMMAYPEEPESSVNRQGSLFSAAQDIGGKSEKVPDSFGNNQDPFGDREKPVFSVQEQQFYGPENGSNLPQGNLVFHDPAAAEQAENRAAEQERLARERAEQERLAREKAEQERLAKEKAEQERLAQERAEQERLAREKAEQERLAQERAEQERLARERAEQERLAREKAEQERLVRERAEQERLAREKAEQERLARERAEQERLAREKAEQERLAGERAEQERLAREREQQARQNFAPGPMPIYETTTLSTSPLKQPPATLIRHRDQSHITIRSTLLRIGRNVSDVDYWVRGNPAIGRHHADILFREGDYYIIDRNSTNHVYVDGKMIAPNEEVLLPNQAVIRLADEDFTFQVSSH